MHKKTENKKQRQTKLPIYYQVKNKKEMYEDNKDGWTVGERVELRHSHQPEEGKKEMKTKKQTGDLRHSHQPEEGKQAQKPKRERGDSREGKESRKSSINERPDQYSSLSAKQSSPVVVQKRQLQKKEQSKHVNVSFYLNKMPSQPYGEYIDRMHDGWYHNYEKLERDHSFIQWIFPNSFQSRFNSHAKPLSREEAEQFRINPEIIVRYLKSYDMMLAFYGMKIKDKHTGELMRSRHPSYKERFYKTLVTSWHNHMRITRILCSLRQTGFGRYAAELCKFLKFQIYDPNGQMRQLKKYNVYKEWEPFEHYEEKGQHLNYFLQRFNKKKEQSRKGNGHEGPAKHLSEPSVKEERPQSLEKSPAHDSRKAE